MEGSTISMVRLKKIVFEAGAHSRARPWRAPALSVSQLARAAPGHAEREANVAARGLPARGHGGLEARLQGGEAAFEGRDVRVDEAAVSVALRGNSRMPSVCLSVASSVYRMV